MTRELDKLLDDVRMNMEYDVYSKLHDEIMSMETDFEETLFLKQQNTALQARIKELEENEEKIKREWYVKGSNDNFAALMENGMIKQ